MRITMNSTMMHTYLGHSVRHAPSRSQHGDSAVRDRTLSLQQLVDLARDDLEPVIRRVHIFIDVVQQPEGGRFASEGARSAPSRAGPGGRSRLVLLQLRADAAGDVAETAQHAAHILEDAILRGLHRLRSAQGSASGATQQTHDGPTRPHTHNRPRA